MIIDRHIWDFGAECLKVTLDVSMMTPAARYKIDVENGNVVPFGSSLGYP